MRAAVTHVLADGRGTPITKFVTAQANYVAGASANVTAGAYESGFVMNLPQKHPIITV